MTQNVENDHISVVLITGGIGAGKSCCVNALVASLPDGARCAVCNQAFIEGSVETTIDRSRVLLYEEVFDDSDFSRLLYRVATQTSSEAGTRITHLLVETTCMAEPLVLVKALERVERFRLDAVVHVLDGRGLRERTAEDTAPWRAAAAAQLALASLVCINLRAESNAEELLPVNEREGEAQPDEHGPQLGGTVTASVGVSIELVGGAVGGAASDLASVMLDATSQFASVTLDGASNVINNAFSLSHSLAAGNVSDSADGLKRLGNSGLSTVSNSAGVLLGAATELGTLGIERVGDVGRKALLAAATVTSAALDDVFGLPSQAADAVGGAGRASFGLAHGMVSAAAAGVMASSDYVADLLGRSAPSAARVVVCLAPGESSAAAGALLWETIALTGGFKRIENVGSADSLTPTVQGGHAARVACVCATEVGTPLVEESLRAWLAELAQSGRVLRIKGLVWMHNGVTDATPRLMVVDGLHEVVEYRAGKTASDYSLTSKLCLFVLDPEENVALIKKAFRNCFVPPGYAWAADVETDFPPQPNAAPVGIERKLQDGPTVVLWRVSSKFYACEAHCPHAGAPLVDGSVLDIEDAARCVLVFPDIENVLTLLACLHAAPRLARC